MGTGPSMRSLKTAAVAATVTVLAAACGSGASAPGKSGSSAPASTAAGGGAAPIKIALITPLTGPSAFLGKGDLQGLTLAVDAVNAHGGIDGHPVQLIVKDYGTSSNQAITDLYAVNGQGVLAIMGPVDSAVAEAFAPVANRLQIPVLLPSDDAKVVTPAQPYIFEDVPLPKYWALPLVQWMKYKGIKRFAVAYDTTNPFGVDGVPAMIQDAKAAGIQVVAQYPFQVSTTDFTPMLANLKQTNAQAFSVWGAGPAEVILTKQFAAAGLNKQMQLLMGGTQCLSQYVQPAGPAANGVVLDCNDADLGTQLPNTTPFTQMVLAFAKAYQQKYGGQPPQFAVDAYAGGQLLFAAMKAAHPLTRANVAAALNHLSLLTVDGSYHYTPTQHGSVSDVNNIAVVRIENGQFVPTNFEKQRFAELPR
ncbi:MAG: ABC transporter substrate-binding protein [Firmicutes bacterium]|nr:ABC transporter substrate-binding protein [Alicyclobacillaceae bacterium]MCL6496226.1 ABC transporter substrate-binding protein [Bacillota bacterium]